MKKRMLGLLVAAVVAAPIALGASPALAAEPRKTAQPAGAQPADIGTIITVISTAISAYKAFTSSTSSGSVATAQIIAAINSAKAEIISHIDAVATAQARACAEEAVIDFADFEALTPDNKQSFALNVTSCVTLIDSLLTVVVDKGALDQLGYSQDEIAPVALMARARTGLTNTNLAAVLVHSNQTIISVLAPSCSSHVIEGRPQYTCIAYNGTTGGPEPSLSLAQNEAGANISWRMARNLLPTFQTL
ncbi:hypothetical protein [Dactylosporangium sp. CA-092794]|uniref:hypothetical protein n=1 Tax=Dactylosporangium sp. CA-092794 TaxID=3239929 RepID=UPI003D939968